MALMIEDEATHRLVQELADLTGETEAAAVTTAIRERLARMQRIGLANQLREIARGVTPGIAEPFRSADHGDVLYDEMGLPQ